MKLCTYSRSAVLATHVLPSCPLSLNTTQKDECICRKRTRVPYGAEYLRVLECKFPNDWRDQPVNAEEARRRAIEESRANKSVPEFDMSESSAVATEKKPADQRLVPCKEHGLWAGVEIPIIQITGHKSSGKSLFAASIDYSRTLYIDAETSVDSYNIPFKKSVSLFKEMANAGIKDATPIEAFKFWKNICDSINLGEYSVVVTDPWDYIQSGLHDWVLQNAAKFGKTKNQYDKASGLLWGDLSTWLHGYLLSIAAKCRVDGSAKMGSCVLICHEGEEFKGGSPTGRKKTKGVGVLYQLASLTLQMDRRPDQQGKIPKVPSAIVDDGGRRSKNRLSHVIPVGTELEIQPIMPPRLAVATPAEIRRYVIQPPDYSKLKKSEMLQPEVLTDDQRTEMQLELERTRLEIEQARAANIAEAKEREARLEAGRLKNAERLAAVQRQMAAKDGDPLPPIPNEPERDQDGNIVPEMDMSDEGSESATQSSESDGSVDSGEPADHVNREFAGPPRTQSVYEIIEEQRQMLKITDAAWLQVLAKRNVSKTTDLPEPEAEKIRSTLYDKLTKAGISAAAIPGAASKN